MKKLIQSLKHDLYEIYREEYLAHPKFFNFFGLYITRTEFLPNYKSEYATVNDRCISTGEIIKTEIIPI